MRRLTGLVLAVLILASSITFVESAESVKVLVDESRMEILEKERYVEEYNFPSDSDWRCSFENTDESWGFGTAARSLREIASVDVRKSGKLSYNSLRNYDVLVIASFTESYSSGEVDAIKQFVENGGGLLFLADFESPNNSVSREFGILFPSETGAVADKKAKKFTSSKHQFYVTDIITHPITKGVDQIAYNFGVPIMSHEKGKSLAQTGTDSWFDLRREKGYATEDDDEDKGPFDVLVAMENASKGRAVFFGCSPSLYNWVVDEDGEQNLDLLKNAVEWLGEPGGPYKQYKLINEQAQQKLSDAESLFGSHEFTQAISACEEAISTFEESNEVYRNVEAGQGIEEAQQYIEKCNTGIEADSIFDKAKVLYDQREYEKAIESFENAQSLYEAIEYTERAQECTTMVEKSNEWISLRKQAKQELEEAENALTEAPSTFDPSGYENTRVLFEKAKTTWEAYDDTEQVALCEEKIQLCNDEIAQIEKTRMMVIILVVVIVAGIVVVVVVLRRRSPRVPEEKLAETEGELSAEKESEAIVALKDRYAKGEITKEEYERLKSVLEKE